MFYRQRVLLALIEVFGRNLSRTDLEKHLFLFCQSSGQKHYDFFPHRYGPFSLTSYDDLRKLIERKLLKESESIQLEPSVSYFNKLHPEDRHAMRQYFRQLGTLRGKDLLRKTYLDHPQYTIRSEIIGDILTADEYKTVKLKWNIETERTLMSLGYEGITIDEYFAKLILNNVTLLLDVRQNPYSHKYGFSQKILRQYVQMMGIQYEHLPQLGIPLCAIMDETTSLKRLT